MKSSRKVAVLLVCILSIIALQSVAAKSYLPAEGQDSFSLEEVYYLNSAMVNCDLLQFMQAYMNPDDPYTFFNEASKWTDDEIETNAYYYFSFIYPEIAGKIPFYYFSDLEEYIAATQQDPGVGPFQVYENVTTFADLREIYPQGIVRCNAYDMLRTTARQLCYYLVLKSEDSKAPSYEMANAYIEYLMTMLEQQYEEAMAAEAAEAAKAAEAAPSL